MLNIHSKQAFLSDKQTITVSLFLQACYFDIPVHDNDRVIHLLLPGDNEKLQELMFDLHAGSAVEDYWESHEPGHKYWLNSAAF